MGPVQRSGPAPVGIPQLDEQHRELHRLLLRLTATLEKDPGGALPEYRFIQLAEETSAHFKSEEAFLQAVGYPDLAAHRLEHREIIQRFWENQVRWDAPCAPPLADLVEAFADSVQRHLESADRAFTAWLESR